MANNKALIATTVPLAQIAPGATKKDHKGFQIGADFNPQEVNAELDRLHVRVNLLTVEDPPQADLSTGGAETNANICLRINAIMAALRKANLLKT